MDSNVKSKADVSPVGYVYFCAIIDVTGAYDHSSDHKMLIKSSLLIQLFMYLYTEERYKFSQR